MNSRPITRISRAALLGASLLGLSPFLSGIQKPIPINQEKPAYDFVLRRDNMEGAVVVSFLVNAKGETSDARIISSTNRAFERSTLKAIRNWTFQPAIDKGRSVPVRVVQLVTFTLPDQEIPTTTGQLMADLRIRDESAVALHVLALRHEEAMSGMVQPEVDTRDEVKSED